MKLSARIIRSVQADIQAELRRSRRRADQRGARLLRLANSWRDKHYPNQQLDAASLIYTKAPQIIRALDDGAVVERRPGGLGDGVQSSLSTGDHRMIELTQRWKPYQIPTSVWVGCDSATAEHVRHGCGAGGSPSLGGGDRASGP